MIVGFAHCGQSIDAAPFFTFRNITIGLLNSRNMSPSPAVTIGKDNFIYSNHVAGGFDGCAYEPWLGTNKCGNWIRY